MITFHDSMDAHSLDIKRNGVFIGFLQWHPERDPRIVLMNGNPIQDITLQETKECLEKFDEIKDKERKRKLSALPKKTQLEERKKYRMTSPDGVPMEFIPMTIDRENDEIYIKITSPVTSHDGFVLSSFETGDNKIEEIEMNA
jgi:hypothetical protein